MDVDLHPRSGGGAESGRANFSIVSNREVILSSLGALCVFCLTVELTFAWTRVSCSLHVPGLLFSRIR